MLGRERTDDLLALNQQLMALDAAGVHLGLGRSGEALSTRFEALAADLPRRVAAGETSEQLLECLGTAATPNYQKLVEEWLSGADLSALLASHYASANGREGRQGLLTYRLAYPLFVATVACLGLAFMCYTTLPVVEATYADLREPVGDHVSWAQQIRATAFLWIWGIPLLLMFGLLAIRRIRPLRLTRHSPEIGTAARSQYAQMSETAAALLEAGVGQQEAIHLAAGHGAPTPKPAPPLLAWACRSTAPESGGAGSANSSDFRAIGSLYRDFAGRGSQRLTALVPLVACVVIGGGATLVYALALFLPVIDLLWALSES